MKKGRFVVYLTMTAVKESISSFTNSVKMSLCECSSSLYCVGDEKILDLVIVIVFPDTFLGDCKVKVFVAILFNKILNPIEL